MLMNGRLLQDKDKVDEIKFDANTIITAFVSPRLKNLDTSKSSNEGSSDDNGDNDDTQIADANSSMVLDAMNGQRGFDYFKANGYTVPQKPNLTPNRTKRSSGRGTRTTDTSFLPRVWSKSTTSSYSSKKR